MDMKNDSRRITSKFGCLMHLHIDDSFNIGSKNHK